ncbi:hypothetical protein ANCCAN_20696 [Ancylostoma caninum]|uniref:Uncharacterized protein n=1 Tax=Ancylostoma caninum TaxID=29170 RepID=A0A368FN43_ANCCA|nr:hypothetical protein ANCCAN_20696 [Ancylostoma caninum]
MQDGKIKISVLVGTPTGAKNMTAFATSEVGDLFRGQVVPHLWREDKWLGDRNGLAFRLGAVQIVNFGPTRQLPNSLSDTLQRSTLSSVCFSGFQNLESIRESLIDKDVIVSY